MAEISTGKSDAPHIRVDLIALNAHVPMEVGDRLKVGVFLSADSIVPDIRELQFDHSDSSGIRVKRFRWIMRRLDNRNEIDLYYKDGANEKYPDVRRANYSAGRSVPREILDLDNRLTLVAIYILKIRIASSIFSIVGSPNSRNRDEGLRIGAGFGPNDVRYTPEDGNISGGVLHIAAVDGE